MTRPIEPDPADVDGSGEEPIPFATMVVVKAEGLGLRIEHEPPVEEEAEDDTDEPEPITFEAWRTRQVGGEIEKEWRSLVARFGTSMARIERITGRAPETIQNEYVNRMVRALAVLRGDLEITEVGATRETQTSR